MKKLMIVTVSVLFVFALMVSMSAMAADAPAAKAKPEAKAADKAKPEAKTAPKADAKKDAKKGGDAEKVQAALADWKKAGEAKDMPKMMATYSAKFSNAEYGDKAGFQKFIQDAIDMGYLDNAQVDMSKAKTTVEGAKATVAGIVFKAAFGQAMIDLTMAKEGEAWKIVGQDVQQQ